MIANQQHRHDYGAFSAPEKSSRSAEYDAIGRVTSNLLALSESRSNFAALVAAVDENRRLWATIASSVVDPDNTLSGEIKAKLFYLHEFTTEHSRKVLKGNAGLIPIIDVNLAVMRGLNSAVPS